MAALHHAGGAASLVFIRKVFVILAGITVEWATNRNFRLFRTEVKAVEVGIVLLKAALKACVEEACLDINNEPIYTIGHLRAELTDDGLLGPRWDTSTDTRLNLVRLQIEFLAKKGRSKAADMLLAVLREAPGIEERLMSPVDDTTWAVSQETLRNSIWESVIGPYIKRCWDAHQRIIVDEEIFEEVFNETVADIQAPYRECETHFSPLAGISLIDGPLELEPELRIRVINPDEAEGWLNRQMDFSGTRLNIGDIIRAQCAIEAKYYRASGFRSNENILKRIQTGQEEDDKILKVLGLLRLFTDQPLYNPFTEKTYRGFLVRRDELSFSDRPHRQIYSSMRVSLDKTKGAELAGLWAQLQKTAISDEIDLPFRRWYGATDRHDDADRIIDYWIALESLFASDSNQEVKFRASLRGAAYLGNDAESYQKIFDQLKHSYDWRSKVVHGGGTAKEQKDLNKKGTLAATTITTRDYLRRIILKNLTIEQPITITAGKNKEPEIQMLQRLLSQ